MENAFTRAFRLTQRERRTARALLRRGFSIFEVAHYLRIVRGTA